MSEEDTKSRAKQMLLEKLRSLDIKAKAPADGAQEQQSEQVSLGREPLKIAEKVDTEQDFKKLPYEGKAKYDSQLKSIASFKAQNNPEEPPKAKKMFYQHYDTSEPYCPNIPNNPNPSGRPPNIPPQMYEGIVVKPKRPWVYLGDQSLPPVQYQQINEKTFKDIQKKHFDKNGPQNEVKPKEPKKAANKKKEMNSDSDDFNEGSDLSDEIELGDSMLMSDYKSQSKVSHSKVSRRSKFKGEKESQVFPYDDDDEMVSEGMETKKKMGKIFDDQEESNSEFEDNDSMEEQSGRKGRKKQSKKEAKKAKNKGKDGQQSD